MAPNHERHPVFDSEFLLLEGNFFDAFFVAEKRLPSEIAQSSVELAMAPGQLLKLFALSQ
jgi:hypothetical protein